MKDRCWRFSNFQYERRDFIFIKIFGSVGVVLIIYMSFYRLSKYKNRTKLYDSDYKHSFSCKVINASYLLTSLASIFAIVFLLVFNDFIFLRKSTVKFIWIVIFLGLISSLALILLLEIRNKIENKQSDKVCEIFLRFNTLKMYLLFSSILLPVPILTIILIDCGLIIKVLLILFAIIVFSILYLVAMKKIGKVILYEEGLNVNNIFIYYRDVVNIEKKYIKKGLSNSHIILTMNNGYQHKIMTSDIDGIYDALIERIK